MAEEMVWLAKSGLFNSEFLFLKIPWPWFFLRLEARFFDCLFDISISGSLTNRFSYSRKMSSDGVCVSFIRVDVEKMIWGLMEPFLHIKINYFFKCQNSKSSILDILKLLKNYCNRLQWFKYRIVLTFSSKKWDLLLNQNLSNFLYWRT